MGEARAGKIKTTRTRIAGAGVVRGHCLCGAVTVEIGYPARWAWHDHARASRLAHGAAYATYVGSWRSRFRVVTGGDAITRYSDKAGRWTRSFCARCGTPLTYERAHAPQMVNIPRALFEAGTGREPLYHIAIEERPDWAYGGGPLGPLKGYPGVVWERPKRRKRAVFGDPLERVLSDRRGRRKRPDQLESNIREVSAPSMTLPATLPKNRASPGRRLTPMTTRS